MINEEEAQRFCSVPNFSFNGRWERLDWKKIATLDVNKIMVTSNVEVLEGLTHQIAHCRPEAEFSVEGDSPDSGLMKVFKFSQLIIQYLSFSLQRMHAQHKQVLAELTQIQTVNQNKTSEIQSLKDTLTQARKELRRRKELLASAQSEVLVGNKDEFDPCPYCSKKFLSSAYLLSHMHRRHQGLPINPKNPSQSLVQLLGNQDREIASSNSFLNTHSNYVPNQKASHLPIANSGVDYALVQEMVEKCLSEKRLGVKELREIVENHGGKEDRQIQTCIEDPETVETRVQDETAAAVASIMAEIKSQLEMQWKYISAKLEQARPNVGAVSEPGELGDSVLLEDHNVSGDNHKGEVHISSVQSTPVKSKDADSQLLEVSTDAVEMELCGPHSPLQHRVNEQLQKQQEELESLRMDLEAKMDQEMNIIEGKLEAQERFWRSKLKLVKEEYDNDVERLRKEFQSQLAEIQESLAHQKPSLGWNENAHDGASNPLYGKSGMVAISDQGLNENVSPIKTPLTEQRPENLYHSTPRGPPVGAFSFYRRASSDRNSHSITEEGDKTGPEEHPSPIVNRRGSTANSFLPSPSLEPMGSQNVTAEAPPAAPIPKPRVTADPVLFIQSRPIIDDPVTTTAVHEYAEASGSMIDQKRDESISSKSEADDKFSKGNTEVNERIDDVIHPAPTFDQSRSIDRQNSVRSVRARLRSKARADADNQPMDESNAEPILSELQFRGTKFQQGYDNIQPEDQHSTTTDAMQQIAGSSKDIRSSQELPKIEVSKSPFTKIVAAMRFSTKKVTKTVKHAIGTKEPARKKSPTLTVAKTKLKKNSKPGLFSKARWKRNKKSDAKSSDKASTRATSDESSEAHSSAIEVERQYVPKVDMGPERAEEHGSRSEASSDSESSCSSASERLQKGTQQRLDSGRIRNMSPLKQKKYQRSHGSNRAADDWPPHPGQRFQNSSPANANVKKTRRGARRSLLQEFEETTPEKDVKRRSSHDHGGDSTTESGTSLESSWDNESAAESLPAVKTTPKFLAEYSEIKPKLEVKQIPPQIEKPAVADTGTSRQLYGTSAKITANRPVTARPRIEVDTWDTEDSSQIDAPPVQKLQLPRPGHFEVAKSATQKYSKNNPSSKPKVQNSKGSPLNNSWDSN